jgi:hypothetical protein
MSKFITLTKSDGTVLYINSNDIYYFSEHIEGETNSFVQLSQHLQSMFVYAKESPEQIMAMLSTDVERINMEAIDLLYKISDNLEKDKIPEYYELEQELNAFLFQASKTI